MSSTMQAQSILSLHLERLVGGLLGSRDNPEGFNVEMGNVGRHYLRWRYGS